jgi:hypothetical protein
MKKDQDNTLQKKESQANAAINNSSKTLPAQLKSGDKAISGADVDNATASKPAQFKAPATEQAVPVNDDPALKNQADVMGAKALSQKTNDDVSPAQSETDQTSVTELPAKGGSTTALSEGAAATTAPAEDQESSTATVDEDGPIKVDNATKGALGIPLLSSDVVTTSRFHKTRSVKINIAIKKYNDFTAKLDSFVYMSEYATAKEYLTASKDLIDSWLKEGSPKANKVAAMNKIRMNINSEEDKLATYTKQEQFIEADDETDAKRFDQVHGKGKDTSVKVVDVLTHRDNINKKEAKDITQNSNNETTDVGSMRKSMSGVVKDMQRNEGEIKGTDTKVQADAATNYYLHKLITDQAKKELNGVDSTDAINTHQVANDVLKSGYLNTISDGFIGSGEKTKKIDTGTLGKYKEQSKGNRTSSNTRVQDSEKDTAIVQMFFNQMVNLEEEEKTNKKEKDKDKKASKDAALRDEAKRIITYSVARENNVIQRFKAQDTLLDRLSGEERISSLGDTIWTATKGAIANGVLKAISFGFLSYKSKVDDRGLSKETKIDGIKDVFNLGLDADGELKADEIEGGFNASFFPTEEINKFYTETSGLNDSLFGTGNFSAGVFFEMAQGLTAIKSIIGRLSEVTSTVMYLSAALSLIPPLAAIFIPVGLICSSIMLWAKFIQAGLSGLIASLNGLVQYLNMNPEIFNKLEGRSIKSGIDFLAEGASVAIIAGMGTTDTAGTGTDSGRSLEQRFNFQDKQLDKGAGLLGDESYKVAKAEGVSSAAAKAGLGATNLLSQSMGADEMADAHKGKKENQKETMSKDEAALLKKSVAASKEKMTKESDSVYGYLVKFSPNKDIPSGDQSKMKPDEQEKAASAQKFTSGTNSISEKAKKAVQPLKS